MGRMAQDLASGSIGVGCMGGNQRIAGITYTMESIISDQGGNIDEYAY